MSTQNIQNTPNLTNKAKTYISLAFSNIIFMFIFYLISTPNSDLINAFNRDNCNITQSVNKTDYNDTHNYTLIYCNCDIAISGITTFRITYNIFHIITLLTIDDAKPPQIARNAPISVIIFPNGKTVGIVAISYISW